MKTVKNDNSVHEFLQQVTHEKRRKDAFVLLQLMHEATGEEPKMWGDSIVGFGRYHYKYASGREGDWMKVGFAPRKQNLTVYLIPYIQLSGGLFDKLGKFKIGKGCIYINKVEDVDLDVLKQIVRKSYKEVTNNN